MPRRTVQEVTVQDVQKRRNPNKHYVSMRFIYSPSLCLFNNHSRSGFAAGLEQQIVKLVRLLSFFHWAKVKTKRVSDYSKSSRAGQKSLQHWIPEKFNICGSLEHWNDY